MTEQERNILKREILNQLIVEGKIIEDLTPVTLLKDNDLFEINDGRNVSFSTLKSAIADYLDFDNINIDLTEYLKKTEAASLYQPKGNYLTGITKAMVEAVLTGTITTHNHDSRYYTETEIDTKITALNTAIGTKLDKSVFDDLFEKVQVNGQWVIRAKYGFYSNQFISALGLVQGDLGGGTGTGGGSLFGLMRSWPSVDPGPSTQEALGANLGWELRGRIAALETAGYATQNWVLNKNYLTAHQDISHLLSKTEAASLYQPKGNYLTSHQSLSHLLRIDGSNGTAAGTAALLNKLEAGGDNINDNMTFITSLSTPGANTAFFRRPMSYLWNYIKGKADAVYQPKGNYALASALTDGSVTKLGTATVGSPNWPIYLNNGVPYACAWKFGNYNGAAAVNNGTLNENLNADMLDGLHVGEAPGRVARFYGFPGYTSFGYEGTADETYFSYLLKKLATDNSGEIMAVGRAHPNSQGVFIMHGYSGRKNGYPRYGSGLYVSIDGRVVPIRIQDGTYTYGHGIFDGNAASASRLQTTATYTAWGQTYFANGVPQSVSGNMSGVGIIKFSAGNEIAFGNSRFCFGTTNQSAAQGVNVGSLLVSNAWADYTKVPVNGIYIKGALRIGDITIEEDKANGGLKISGGVYATKYVSALGQATGNLSGGSGVGGTAYDRLDAWADYTTDKAGYVLSAGLGADLNSRVGANATSINSILSRLNSLEGSVTTSVTVTGSGNAITDISKGGTAIIATKGATFLTQHQALDHINVKDIRNTAPKPNDYVSNRLTAWFNNSDKPVAGLSEWYSGINVTGWSSSNYAEWELAATATTHLSDKNLYFRVGLGASWDAWQKILTSANYASVLGSVYQAKGDYFTNQGHLTNKDLDSIISSGAGYIDATSTNKPSTIGYGQLLTLHGSGDTITQMAFDYANSGNVWVRSGNPSQVGGVGTWNPWVQMLTATNYASTIDSRYVKKSGDTMTGELDIQMNGHKLRLYHDNYTHIQSDVEFVFDKRTWANGTSPNVNNTYSCGEPSYRWSNVYATTINVTSTGLVSNLNADLLDGKHYSQMASGGHAQYTPAGPAAGRWIRIAKSNTIDNGSIYNAYAIISLTNSYYNTTTQGITFAVYIGYRSGETCTITQLGGYGGSLWPKARIVYPTAANTAYYIEVYYATTSILNEIGVEMTGSFNMELYDTYTAGEIPTGYAAKEQPLTVGMSAERFTSSVGTGTAPLTVASTTLVSNLNADMLDGLHSTAFSRADQIPAVDLNTVNGFGIMCNPADANATLDRHYPTQQAGTLFYGTGAYGSANQIYGAYSSNRWFARGGGSGVNNKTAWREFAFTDSNVASATKLQTARSLWGQSFDGSANVSGNMTGVGSITGTNYLINDTASNPYLKLTHDSLAWHVQGWQGKLFIGQGSAHGMQIDRNGRVGIKLGSSASPAYDLDVTGTGRFTGQLRCDSLRIGDAVFTYDAAHNGIKLDKGLYSEGYLTALGLSELTNTKFTINAGYESDALTILGGGITRSGYSGDVWNKGYGALNVAIDTSAGDSKQTPLLLAFSAGATDLDVSTSRLFALELLNNGDTLDFKLAGEVKLSINKIGLSAWSATLNYINATSIGTATVTATGKITCQSLTQTSDMRLKNVVRPIDLSVEAIAKAPSFIHQWKRGGAFDLGSSAQYWKEMSPLFTPRDKDGFLTMQYGKAALLSAIAIARRTVSHEERIRNLESENKKLRAELNGLKARLRA